ncbi:MAG: T9SS type A sorting domain-containing protein [Bacteroidales bacterium]|nr:T9SS type A sorting domain-containing protein [Candidatus Scybalocola fimicaballi]
MLKITVSDISGKKLKVIDQIKSQQKSLDLSDFPSGCYFVIVETEHSRIVKKIIKK